MNETDITVNRFDSNWGCQAYSDDYVEGGDCDTVVPLYWVVNADDINCNEILHPNPEDDVEKTKSWGAKRISAEQCSDEHSAALEASNSDDPYFDAGCACAATWTSPSDGASCASEQQGCTKCQADDDPWCSCADDSDYWTYCDQGPASTLSDKSCFEGATPPFTPTNDQLSVAAQLWCQNKVRAEWQHGNIAYWKTDKITTMQNLFSVSHGCTPLNEAGLTNWNVSQVTDFSQMFYGLQVLSICIAPSKYTHQHAHTGSPNSTSNNIHGVLRNI